MLSIESTARLCSSINPLLVSRITKTLASSRWVNNILESGENRRLSGVHDPREILVISDVNIGDAVLTQSIISNFKNCIPELKASYLYQRLAYPLIRANPFIYKHFPLFKNLGLPSEEDVKNVKETVESNNFDLIINLCPFIPQLVFKNLESCIIQPFRLIAETIRAYNSNNHMAHLVFQLNKFSNRIANKICSRTDPVDHIQTDLQFPHIFADKNLLSRTKSLMQSLNIPFHAKKILFNPDSSSKFTLIPFQFQKDLLKGILSFEKLDLLLMNSGFTFNGIEKRLYNEIPGNLREKIIVIPKNTDIDVSAGLIDNVDLFISADTAPLHIGAAKKYFTLSSNDFKNSTAVVGIFGATSAKVYGYDSFFPGHLPSAQDAPSKAFEAFPPCKNITCFSKKYKDCEDIKCFDGLNSEQVVEYCRNYLS